MLGNGKILKQEDPTDVDYISTTIANSKVKAKKDISPRQMLKNRAENSPAGAKCHFYQANNSEYEDNYVTKWKEIHRGIGMNQGQ